MVGDEARKPRIRLTVEAAGLPCEIEALTSGDWVVMIAGTSVSRRWRLPEAIVEASGGLVGVVDAEAISQFVVAQLSRQASTL